MSWCMLADCERKECHHCFPVINCSQNHLFCREYGICKEIIPKEVHSLPEQRNEPKKSKEKDEKIYQRTLTILHEWKPHLSEEDYQELRTAVDKANQKASSFST